MTDPQLHEATRLATLHRRLGSIYSQDARHAPVDPVDQLVMTILSQNTSDGNTRRSYQALREAFADWSQVVNAPPDILAEVISSGGLANQKAPTIQRALRRIQAERGEFDLYWLADLPVTEARAWLTGIKGVGAKTASIVLLFSLNQPAFPVDTHVGRVLRRIGIAPAQASATTVMTIVESLTPPAWYYPLHINLIRLGREVCQARQPRCQRCPLSDLCHWYQQNRSEDPNV